MPSTKNTDYKLLPDGTFAIKDYNNKKPFSNFLPGIAGLHGTPMWVFYANRAQGITSFGTKNKDSAILEFFPANKAYQNVSHLGFRTFVKVFHSGKAPAYYEPFQPASTGQIMEVSSHELCVRDHHGAFGLETSVRYFTVPRESMAVLARELTLENRGSGTLELQVLDGLPQVNPFGMNEFLMKQMSRTIEAWMLAENVDRRAPFLRLKVDSTDRPEVVPITEGHFFFSFLDKGRTAELLPCFVDPVAIFGARTDFAVPKAFLDTPVFKANAHQLLENRTPCAFSLSTIRLAPGQSRSVRSFYGHSRSLEGVNRFASRAAQKGYFDAKRQENCALVESIKGRMFTVTSKPAYDLYCGQNFLDNAMRGGIPVWLGTGKDGFIYYAYSRKHGDPERDYNRFNIEPCFFSQGDGNYRDVNQNRRSDVWFEPRVEDLNIRTFLNLIQLDGFNPLVLKGSSFQFKMTTDSRKTLASLFGKKAQELTELLSGTFSLGQLYGALVQHGLIRPEGFNKVIATLKKYLIREEKAEHGEGFWTDHWTYNLDLVESYLAIYPEKARELIFGTSEYTFFDNTHRVRPREERYWLLKEGVRQYKAVAKDDEKVRRLAHREMLPNAVRMGVAGPVFKTTLFVKLFTLLLNKFASLDAQGAGVEMEADKPSWYDALNGLPGLCGSSLPETFELKRLAVFLVQIIDDCGMDPNEEIRIPVETAEFFSKVSRVLDAHLRESGRDKDYVFWDTLNDAKERFRRDTFFSVLGKEKKIPLGVIKYFLEHVREKIEIGLDKCVRPDGLYPTYFRNEVEKYCVVKDTDEGRHVLPMVFRSNPLPLFLEGPVHALKVEKDPARRKKILKGVRASGLYDRKLGMYKVNAPMQAAPLEVGRGRIFTPGWLENESIWLHMEYKFLLEMLKAGLNEEFFEDFEKALVPFQSPERYGRSVLENSSFLVSSAFPDTSLHGAGFVARLSGSTAEWVSLWLLMNVGKRPFSIGPDGKVTLRFEPRIPEWMFLKEDVTRVYYDEAGTPTKVRAPKDSVAFLFLSKTVVFYHNPKRLNTYGRLRVSVKKIRLRTANGSTVDFKGDTIPSPWSLKVREGLIGRIDIELG